MNTDPKKALTRISLINGARVCDPQKLRTPERLEHSVTHRSFTWLRVADPRSGCISIRAQRKKALTRIAQINANLDSHSRQFAKFASSPSVSIRVHPWLKNFRSD
jgi:hypothetical protein